MNELNLFRLAILMQLISNDLHHVHFQATDEDFDKTHDLMSHYYEELNEQVDIVMEIALEKGENIANLSTAMNVLPDYHIEVMDHYSYKDAVDVAIKKLSMLVGAINQVRESTDDNSIQSKLDDITRGWEKELNYKLNRRSVPRIGSVPVIDNGVDDEVVGYMNRLSESNM